MGTVVDEKKNHGMGLKERMGRRRSLPRIDMTPVVDLAFLLLTFFMLATTFIKPQVMDLVLPEDPMENDASRPLINEKKILNVVLGANNKIYWYVGVTDPQVHEADYSADGLRKILVDQNRVIEKMYVLVKPDASSTYENLVDMLDELAITGMERYALVDMAPEDEALVRRYAAGSDGGGNPS